MGTTREVGVASPPQDMLRSRKQSPWKLTWLEVEVTKVQRNYKAGLSVMPAASMVDETG